MHLAEDIVTTGGIEPLWPVIRENVSLTSLQYDSPVLKTLSYLILLLGVAAAIHFGGFVDLVGLVP